MATVDTEMVVEIGLGAGGVQSVVLEKHGGDLEVSRVCGIFEHTFRMSPVSYALSM